jgi:hypothetical protein
MRTIIFAAILFGNLITKISAAQTASSNDVNTSNMLAVAADMQSVYSSWDKGAPTNGIVCAISFAPSSWKGSPVIYVNFINTTTNYIRGLLQIPIEARANIELLDSEGKAVPKTNEGKKFGVWTDQQMKDWFEDNREKPPQFPWSRKSERDTKGIAVILFPLLDAQISVGISLPLLFQIKQAGKYTLHFQIRVAQTKVDTSGKIDLNIFWLPEVVAKVQIRPEDIPLTNSIPNG